MPPLRGSYNGGPLQPMTSAIGCRGNAAMRLSRRRRPTRGPMPFNNCQHRLVRIATQQPSHEGAHKATSGAIKAIASARRTGSP